MYWCMLYWYTRYTNTYYNIILIYTIGYIGYWYTLYWYMLCIHTDTYYILVYMLY